VTATLVRRSGRGHRGCFACAALALSTAALPAAFLSGCSDDIAPTNSTNQVSPVQPSGFPSGVVATGLLAAPTTSQSGPVAGRVSIVANPSTRSFTIQLAGFSADVSGGVSIELLSERVSSVTACVPTGLTYSAGESNGQSSQSYFLSGDDQLTWGNPSFFTDLAITQQSTPASTSCPVRIVGIAPLKWTIGDTRPEIQVADHGSRPGAEGSVESASGRPTAYTVAANDNLTAIAARFGVSISDLFYLNPAREPNPQSLYARAGEVLNLSKSNR